MNGKDESWRIAAHALGLSAAEIAKLEAEMAASPTLPTDQPRQRLPEPTPEEIADMERVGKMYHVWFRWKVDQMKRCNTMKFRRMVVKYLDEKIDVEATEVPDGVWEHLDILVNLDAMEKPETSREMNPGFAPTLYQEIQDEVWREQRGRRGRRGGRS